MGTNCAVSLAELCLGYLEDINELLPPTWYRFIDDGLKTVHKSNHINEIQH